MTVHRGIMRSASRLCLPTACVLLAVTTAASAQEVVRPKGPDELPRSLPGDWKITLCIRGTHCWIRLQSQQTGELHTLSRYRHGWGEHRDAAGRLVTPVVSTSGVQWDQDLVYESVDCDPWDRLLSLIVRDPVIYRGQGNGRGYSAVNNNCATYVRDAWVFYGGRRYDLLVSHVPSDLRDFIINTHPKLRQAWRHRRSGARRR